MACAPSEDSDQPGHPPSLISRRLTVAWVLSYPLSAKRRLCLSLRWAHMPFCWFCHEAAHLVPQRRLSVLNFFSVARPRKFGNLFVEQSWQAACTPLRAHDSCCDLRHPSRRRLSKHADSRLSLPSHFNRHVP